jgi:lysyl endopeptidase
MRRKWLTEGFVGRGVLLTRMLYLAVLILAFADSAFAKMYEEPRSFSLPNKSLQQVDRKVLKAIDPKRLLEEDRPRGKSRQRPVPLRFAVTEDVALDLNNSGTWQDLPDGRLWRLRLHSSGAVSHNLGITRFDLPQGAKLWIYDPDGKHVEGPYTQRNRSQAGSLWTPIIEGDEIVVEVVVSGGAGQPAIAITKVNKGYRAFLKTGLLGGSEGPCNIDVVCPEGAPWPNEIRAVNAYTISGTSACTGTLMNNTALDFKPYVLSANHCGVTSGTAASVVAYWNFQSATCGTHGPGSTADNQSGAIFRAANATSDFVLFELSAMPDPGFNVFYAGWDRSGVAPPGVACIHHPSADVKAISFATTPPVSSGSFWQANWDVNGPNGDVAITEHGSSGSCIFATDTHRCIGQEQGGPSFCGAPPASLNDSYGKFSVSWTGGGTNSTRLSNWLDPGNTGVLGLDGDPHITTLDGTHYDFQGAGEFVALRAGTGAEIQVRQAPIATDFNPGANAHTGLATCVSLNTAVAARVGRHRVTYQPNLSGVPDPSGLQLRVDGKLTTLPANGMNLAGGGRIAKTAAPGGIEIAFPDAYTLTVTPGWWSSQSKWYLNVGVVRTSAASAISGAAPTPGAGGIAGSIPAGNWLPTLPDGSAMGPRPAALHDRYVDLYQKFGEAWRVSGSSSLFDYAPGTSTDTFTLKTWPVENPPCVLPETTPVKPVSIAVAQRACIEVRDRAARANCVFDVQVTGERGFARTYLASQRVASGATRIDLRGERSGYGQTFVATVTRRSAALKGVPTGTVELTIDGERTGEPVRLDARGRAVWKATNLPAGKHVVRVGYIPREGSGFLSSTSDEEHVVIGKD